MMCSMSQTPMEMWSLSNNLLKGLSVVFLLALVACKGNQTRLPRLEFSHDSCDLGTIYKNSPIKDFDIEFRNTGAQTLNVFKVKSTCSCTVVNAVDSFVEPGAKGHIRGTFDMSRYPARRIRKHLVVFSNGTKEPVHYSIVGDVTYKKK